MRNTTKNPKRVGAALRQHAKARKAKREAKEAATPIIPRAPRPRPGFKPIGQRRYDRIIRRMGPGFWHSRGDLARAAGFSRDARGYVAQVLIRNALATRAANPQAASGTKTRPAPQWLYRLTKKGEALQDMLRLL